MLIDGNISESVKKKSITNAEAAVRLKRDGLNVIFEKKKDNIFLLILKKFNSPLLVILLVASALSFFLGEQLNSLILILMVFFSVGLDFINTYKSEKAAEKLASRVVATATVVRGELPQEVPIRRIVVGDIILLSAGDIIPADSKILESKDFFVNDAALTGESFPQEGLPGSNVFMGTSVSSGYASVEVFKTGKGTEYGKIAERLGVAETETSFEKDIKKFSLFIMKVAIVLVSLVFIINVFVGRSWLVSLLFALAIAVGMTPELLPVILTVSLSRGSMMMSKKKVIVKNLSAIENFGGMDVFCTDKTGTLTEDRIVLVKSVGVFGSESENVLLYSLVSSTFHTGVNNPLDLAVREFQNHLSVAEYKKIDEIPFDFTRKRDSIVAEKDGKRIMISKGAPEEVFKITNFYEDNGKTKKIDAGAKEKIEKEFDKLSEDGFRVLAVAVKEVDIHEGAYRIEEEKDMVFAGFICFLDPAKKGVLEAINKLEELGIELKILTGDNELLTKKICKDIDLPVKSVITGKQLELLSDDQLKAIIGTTTIFARVSPEQKEKIILTLKGMGKTVGYLGDGINDAPALKAADVGVSVNNAVDVAKETADIILLEKSLMVLRDGVVEGRKIFQNTSKYMLMNLSSNFGNMFSMMGASAFLPFLPMLPVQVLLNNFLYDSSQLALSGDSVDDEDVKTPPSLDMDFLKKYMVVFGAVSSVFDFLTFFVLYKFFNLLDGQFQTGWFIESIATQTLIIYIIRTRKIPFIESMPSKFLLFNTLMVVVLAFVLPFTPARELFSLSPVPLVVLVAIIGIVFAYAITTELVKRIFYKKYYIIK